MHTIWECTADWGWIFQISNGEAKWVLTQGGELGGKNAKFAASLAGEGIECSPWLIEASSSWHVFPLSVIQQDEDKKP